jgi:hypothetical protein
MRTSLGSNWAHVFYTSKCLLFGVFKLVPHGTHLMLGELYHVRVLSCAYIFFFKLVTFFF